MALGERRANAVKEFLVSLGVEPGRITTISYGKERPAAKVVHRKHGLKIEDQSQLLVETNTNIFHCNFFKGLIH